MVRETHAPPASRRLWILPLPCGLRRSKKMVGVSTSLSRRLAQSSYERGPNGLLTSFVVVRRPSVSRFAVAACSRCVQFFAQGRRRMRAKIIPR